MKVTLEYIFGRRSHLKFMSFIPTAIEFWNFHIQGTPTVVDKYIQLIYALAKK